MVQERLLRHSALVESPGAAETAQNILLLKAFLESPLQIPLFIVGSKGIIHHDQTVFIIACQNNKVLAVCKERLALHQGNDNLAFPQRIQCSVEIGQLLPGQLHRRCALFQTCNVILCGTAEIPCQFIRQILVLRQIRGNHGQAGHAAAIVGDGTAAVHIIRIVRLQIQGNFLIRHWRRLGKQGQAVNGRQFHNFLFHRFGRNSHFSRNRLDCFLLRNGFTGAGLIRHGSRPGFSGNGFQRLRRNREITHHGHQHCHPQTDHTDKFLQKRLTSTFFRK